MEFNFTGLVAAPFTPMKVCYRNSGFLSTKNEKNDPSLGEDDIFKKYI